MVLDIFATLVAFLAVVYAGIAKFIQSKLVNRVEVESIQAESKKLSEELKKAQKTGNQAKIDEAMKRQMEFLPKMNKIMMGQFKPMIVILAFFFAFTWGVGQLDPTVQDDITVKLVDDGTGCDAKAADGIFSGCYSMENENHGKWTYTAKAYKNGGEVGSNRTYFTYNADEVDSYVEGPMGQPVQLSTDKRDYFPGETVELFAQSQGADSIEASLDNGTFFRVDLPITIPILNVQKIYQPYWWFILISLITNLSLSVALGKLRKKK
jgi:hypothetical protein